MELIRVKRASQLIGVSEDTLRRWAEQGKCRIVSDDGGRAAISGEQLAALCVSRAAQDDLIAQPIGAQSARNRFTGIITRLIRDGVMAHVEVQAGPHRIVSLISRQACDELDLRVGSLVVTSVKATNVSVEIPAQA